MTDQPTVPDVDRRAPIVVDGEVVVPAAPAAVWACLADIAGWSEVYAELRDVEVDGPVAVGTEFSFRSGPGRIEATVEALDEPHLLLIGGKGMGATSQYRFVLEPVLGGTRVRASQSMSGMAVRTMKRMLLGIAESSLQDWLAGIRDHVVAARA